MGTMKRVVSTTVFVVGLVLVLAVPAWAGDCVNRSRQAPEDPTQVQISGNWVWFPGFGWSFLAPGTEIPGVGSGAGDAGNFKAGDGHALLDGAAACDLEGRQTEHGIQRANAFIDCNGEPLHP